MHPWDTVPMGDSTEMGSKYKGDINSLIIPKQEPDTESPTTSSTFSIQHQLGYYEYLQKPIGFNPLTPPTPGYSTPTLPTFNATNLYEQEPTSTRYLESRVSPVIREATSSVPGLVSPNSVNCSGVLTPGHTPSPQPHNSPRSIGSLSPAPSTSSPRRAKTKKSDSTSSSSSGDDSNRGTIKKKTKSRVTKRRLPNGKNKAYKCKHCKMLFPIKADYWTHLVTHIRPERIISCPKCEFVTEFKHHFEYHIRNHDGVKPYKCSECNYTGTSKSMLESHLKHHSTIYQYRCQDCGYATKHLHSLKMHLKNFTHQPAVVLNPDGTENPDIIIDVYGRRRGPKNRNGRITKREMKPKKVSQKPSSSSPNVNRKKSISPPPTISSTRTIQPPTTQPQPVPELVNPSLPQGLLNLFQQHTHPYPALLPYLNLNLQMMAAQRQALMNLSPRDDTPRSTTVNHHSDDDNGRGVPEEPTRSNIPIDLTLPWQNGARQSSVKQINNKSPSPSPALSESESKLSSYQPINHHTPTGPKNNRRKGRAFKLQISDIEDNNSESAYELNKLNSMASSCSSNDSLTNDSDIKERDTSEQDTTEYGHVTGHTCKHCEITFKNEIMYTMHMGYHGFEDEFQCNSCGERTKDRVAFFMHIYKTKHN